jgi:hypothetical protein
MAKRFARGDSSVAEIQAVVDQMLSELRDPKQAEAQGVPVGAAQAAEVEVAEQGHGVEPVSIVIGLSLAAAGKIAARVWDDILWPRIKRRIVKELGEGALGEEK